MPVGQEESLLRDAEQAGDQRKESQSMLRLGGGIQGLHIEQFHKVLNARNIHLVFNGL